MISDRTVSKGVKEGKLRCKKHPKYQAKRYPYSKCPRCLEIWEMKTRPPADLATYEGDSMEEYPSPPADARVPYDSGA